MARIEVAILGNIVSLQNSFRKGGQDAKKFAKDTESTIERAGSKINSTLLGVGQGIAAAFSVGMVIRFTDSVIKATSEVQKMGAVLTNALGSKALADSSIKQLQEFAAVTPFGVNELTGAFVKLVNQGFTPTMDQIRQLGDLASSTGKSFDQLTEAIIDAQVGEYERLKEFGVRAKDSGDTVIFTFKGVQTQVEKTSSAIREYITGLGTAEGVSGSMAAISSTLAGQISNVQDSYDQMLISIGNNTSGAFSAAIAWVDSLISRVTDLNRELEIANKFGIEGDFWSKVNRALNPFSGKNLTEREKSVIAVMSTEKWTTGFVRDANNAAKSTEDFDKAIRTIQISIENLKKEDRPLPEINAMVAEYTKGIQSLIDLQKKFVDNVNKPADANFGKKAGEEIENQYGNLLKSLSKYQQEYTQSFLTGYEKELQASQNKYDQLKQQAEQFYSEGKLMASQYAAVLMGIDQASVRDRIRIIGQSGINNAWDKRLKDINTKWRPWTGQAQPQGLRTTGVVPTQLPNQIAQVDMSTSPEWDKFVDELDKQLSRSVQHFGRDFLRTLSNINQQANVTFGGIVSTLVGSLTGGITEVFSTTFSQQLSSIVKSSFKDMGKTMSNIVAGVGIAGSVVSGAFKPTSVGGQALGGALGGAAAGFALGGPVGAIAGGLVGAISGALGAASAKKIQQEQLAEQRKQTALLERANALSYASSIVGQMTAGGAVTGVTRDAFGQLVATVRGDQLQFVLQRSGGSR